MQPRPHQIEGSTIKIDGTTSIRIGSNEKIKFIKDNYNLKDIAIMAHFIEELLNAT